MSKYIAASGVDVTVISPKNADYNAIEAMPDPQGVKVIRREIFEIRKWFSRFNKSSSKSKDNLFYIDRTKLSLKDKLSLWIRANVFIPDARRPWVTQISGFVNNYIKSNAIDILITTGPPHSLHIVGLKAKKKTDVRWIADFRDPWTAIEYHDLMPLTNFSARLHKKLEAKVLKSADRVVTVSPSWAQDFERLGAKNPVVVYNGYEEPMFQGLAPSKSEKFVIAHMGTLRSDRNPHKLWKELANLDPSQYDVDLYGSVSEEVRSDMTEAGMPETCITLKGNVDHHTAIKGMFTASLLLLLVNKNEANSGGRIPAKIFEYLRSGKPILLLGDIDGDAADLIRKHAAGFVVDYQDGAKIKEILSMALNTKKSLANKDYMLYSRENQSKEYIKLLNELV